MNHCAHCAVYYAFQDWQRDMGAMDCFWFYCKICGMGLPWKEDFKGIWI